MLDDCRARVTEAITDGDLALAESTLYGELDRWASLSGATTDAVQDLCAALTRRHLSLPAEYEPWMLLLILRRVYLAECALRQTDTDLEVRLGALWASIETHVQICDEGATLLMSLSLACAVRVPGWEGPKSWWHWRKVYELVERGS